MHTNRIHSTILLFESYIYLREEKSKNNDIRPVTRNLRIE